MFQTTIDFKIKMCQKVIDVFVFASMWFQVQKFRDQTV